MTEKERYECGWIHFIGDAAMERIRHELWDELDFRQKQTWDDTPTKDEQ
jgi:hypothetical protein